MQARAFLSIEVSDPINLALNFAAENAIVEFVYYLSNLLDVIHRLRAVVRKHALQSLRWGLCFVRLGIDRVVPQQRILGEHGARIHPETIDPAAHPKSQDVRHRS